MQRCDAFPALLPCHSQRRSSSILNQDRTTQFWIEIVRPYCVTTISGVAQIGGAQIGGAQIGGAQIGGAQIGGNSCRQNTSINRPADIPPQERIS